MSPGEQYRARVLEAVNVDIVCNESGTWLFWQTGNNGALTSAALRIIADELDRRESLAA